MVLPALSVFFLIQRFHPQVEEDGARELTFTLRPFLFRRFLCRRLLLRQERRTHDIGWGDIVYQIDQRVGLVENDTVFKGPLRLDLHQYRVGVTASGYPSGELRRGGKKAICAPLGGEALLKDVGICPAPGSLIEYRWGAIQAHKVSG